MQTEEALQRVAYEQAEDLSRDGIIYFETRFAPLFHTRKGLTHQQIVSAVLKGLERGAKISESLRFDHLAPCAT
jgi:adenosine deaminase